MAIISPDFKLPKEPILVPHSLPRLHAIFALRMIPATTSEKGQP